MVPLLQNYMFLFTSSPFELAHTNTAITCGLYRRLLHQFASHVGSKGHKSSGCRAYYTGGSKPGRCDSAIAFFFGASETVDVHRRWVGVQWGCSRSVVDVNVALGWVEGWRWEGALSDETQPPYSSVIQPSSLTEGKINRNYREHKHNKIKDLITHRLWWLMSSLSSVVACLSLSSVRTFGWISVSHGS